MRARRFGKSPLIPVAGVDGHEELDAGVPAEIPLTVNECAADLIDPAAGTIDMHLLISTSQI